VVVVGCSSEGKNMTKNQIWSEYERLRQIKIRAGIAEIKAISRDDFYGQRDARDLFEETTGQITQLVSDWVHRPR